MSSTLKMLPKLALAKKKIELGWSLLQTLDEWGFSNASIRYRWWYLDRLAFLIDQVLGVPQDQLSSLGSYHVLAAQFKTIGGVAFGFMLPVLAGYIGFSIAEKTWFCSWFRCWIHCRFRFCIW